MPLYTDADNDCWSVSFHSSPPRVTLSVLYPPVPWHSLSIFFHRLVCAMPPFKLSFCGWWVGGRGAHSHSFCSIDFWPNLGREERVNNPACFWMHSLLWLSWNEGASASFLLISNSCIACFQSYTFLQWSSRVVSGSPFTLTLWHMSSFGLVFCQHQPCPTPIQGSKGTASGLCFL